MKACKCKPPAVRRTFLGLVLPTVVLVLLPKCPLCLAAYAASLGIGLSFSSAETLRTAISIACVAVLVLVLVRGALRANAK
jgi:hypothetical protein